MEGHPNCKISFKDLGEGLEKGRGRSSLEAGTTRLRELQAHKVSRTEGQTGCNKHEHRLWHYTVQTRSD